MATSALLGSYLQYKHDTDVVASWLAITSRKLGYSAPFSAQADSFEQTAPSKSTRLKGKARKDAKKAAGPSANAPAKKHILAIKDFVPLAQHIAGVGKKLKQVPVSFASALARVIEARRAYSAALGRDRGHAHFIGVLESVQVTLSPLMPPEQPRASAQDGSADNESVPLTNRFAQLNVEEPSQEFLDAPDIMLPDPVELPFSMEKPDDDADECFFALRSLFGDIVGFRARLKALWGHVGKGFRAHRGVAVATNIAIQLVRAMEEAIVPLLERNGGTVQLLHRLCATYCDQLDLFQKQAPMDLYNYDCYPVADKYLLNALIALRSFHMQTRQSPPGRAEFESPNGILYDENIDPSDHRQRFDLDSAALFEMLCDRTTLDFALGDVLLVHDELSRGIKLMKETDKVPIWLCFAAQIHIDILGVLRQDLPKVEEYFISTLSRAHARIPIESERTHCAPDLQKSLNDFHHQAAFWTGEHDPLTVIALEADPLAAVAQPVDAGTTSMPNRFRKYNPLYYGLLLNHMEIWLHGMSLQYAMSNLAIQSSVQLLHALELEEVIDAQRKPNALEQVRRDQPWSTFFVGGSPSDAAGHWKNFSLTNGMSLADMHPMSRRRNPNARYRKSKAGMRTWKDHCRLSMFLMDRAQRERERAPVDTTFLQEMLDKLQSVEVSTYIARMVSKGPALSLEQSRTGRIRNAADLVHKVALAVSYEDYPMQVDYFEASRIAMFLTAKLCRLCNRLGPPEFVLDPNDVHDAPMSVGIMFSLLAGTTYIQSDEDHKRLLKAAADVVQETYETMTPRVGAA